MQRNTNIFFSAIVVIIIVSVMLANCLYIVDQRQCALVVQFGQPIRQVMDPGLHARIPFIQEVLFFEKRIQTAKFPLKGQSIEVMGLDQKTMKLDAYAKYRIVDQLKFYQTVLDEERFKLRIVSVMESSIREVIGTVPFADVLGSKRVEVVKHIVDLVRKQAKSFGVEVIDLRLARVNLPDKARNAVYDRMRSDRAKEATEIRALGVEEGQRIRANTDREKVVILAEAKGISDVTKGEGEAEASIIFAAATSQDPEFFNFYRSMQAYKASMLKNSTSIMMSSDSDFLTYFK